ncbi:unnamed protein product [Phytophthora fragariaefolia]|uniref:Unnamed protein product n=1 Tax=Phytophthora fragariaefolia TaxID=1490495 RepID=A0A9W6XU91_9STRA|nr:unnamed protein product [Phytophthora fragariaefolia]
MINKLPEPEVQLPYLAVPYVTPGSCSQLGLHLADALRTQKDLRPAVLQLLNCLGRPLGTNTQILADIREEDWTAANAMVPTNLEPVNRTKSGNHRRREKHRTGDSGAKPGTPEWVQFVVQQCFEVSLAELSIEECVVSESDGTRQYPIFYDEETEVPFAPTCLNEAAREECMTKYNILGRGIGEMKDVQLICHLVAKEFDAITATITALRADRQYPLALVSASSFCVTTERAKSICAHAMVSGKPFLVRNTMLDVRFRNFASVRGDTEGVVNRVLFYFGFPIIAANTDTVVAMLCVMDSRPRKTITTMQYSVMKKLAEILSTLWTN